MPRLSETLMSHQGVPAGYVPVATPQRPPADPILTPVHNTFIRTPIPPIWTANPDSVRQFDVGGRVPQFRIYAQQLSK